MRYLESKNSQRHKVESRLPRERRQRERTWEVTVWWGQNSVGDDEEGLEVEGVMLLHDNGNELTAPAWTRENGPMVHFTSCIFYHNKKDT